MYTKNSIRYHWGDATMKHLFIINPVSFPKESEMAAVISEINDHFKTDAQYYHIHISRFPRDGIRYVRKFIEAAQGEMVRVYAVGGDGVVFDCLNGLSDMPNAQLAIVPYGIYSDFLRVFGDGSHIREIFRSIRTMATAGTMYTDVISLGHRRTLSFVTMGLEALAFYKHSEMRRKYPNLAKRLGRSFYKIGGPLAVLDKRGYNFEYEITIDGKSYDGRYVGIHISNSGVYGGNMVPAPMARPDDGWLDIITVSDVSRATLIRMMGKYTSGKYYMANDETPADKYIKETLRHIRGKEITVRSNNPMYVNADSETHHDVKMNINILPAHLQIVVPDGLSYVRRDGKTND